MTWSAHRIRHPSEIQKMWLRSLALLACLVGFWLVIWRRVYNPAKIRVRLRILVRPLAGRGDAHSGLEFSL